MRGRIGAVVAGLVVETANTIRMSWADVRSGQIGKRLNGGIFLPVFICGALMLSGCSTSMSAASLVRNQELEQQQAAASASGTVPDDRKLYLSLIQEMQSKGMFYASLAHVDAFEKKYGVRPDIELLRGDALRETSQQDAAIQVYRSLLSSPVAARAQHGIGRALAAQHKINDAARALNAAVQLDPTNVDFLNDLAFAYLADNETTAARVPIAQAAELAPNNKKVLANLALYLILTGQSSAADQVAAKAKLPEGTMQATRALALQLSMQHGGTKTSSSQTTRDPLTALSTPNAQPSVASSPESVIAGAETVSQPHAQSLPTRSTSEITQSARGGKNRDRNAVVVTSAPPRALPPVAAPEAAVLPPVLPSTLAWQGGPVLQRFGDTP